MTHSKVIVKQHFVEAIMKDILHPHIHENNSPAEVCGSMNIIKHSEHSYELTHDERSVNKHKNKNGFQMGGLEDGLQFCQPKKYVSNILWHTHPSGVAPYPSGSDLMVTAISDCGAWGTDGSAQALIEFLFTEPGVWIFYRNPGKSPIDITKVNANDVMDMAGRIEREVLREYVRSPVPDSIAITNVQDIMNRYSNSRVHVEFHKWSEGGLQISLPTDYLEYKVSGTCIRK